MEPAGKTFVPDLLKCGTQELHRMSYLLAATLYDFFVLHLVSNWLVKQVIVSYIVKQLFQFDNKGLSVVHFKQ